MRLKTAIFCRICRSQFVGFVGDSNFVGFVVNRCPDLEMFISRVDLPPTKILDLTRPEVQV